MIRFYFLDGTCSLKSRYRKRMQGRRENRWIVLLDKSPKGPLTESEIHELLKQKVLRYNDLAFQILVDGEPSARTEWKLLWQFPPFNRRTDAPPSPAVEADRRNAHAPAPTDTWVAKEIPEDLLEISPEELIPRSGGIQAEAQRLDSESGQTRSSPASIGGGDGGLLGQHRYLSAGLGICAVLGAWWLFTATPTELAEREFVRTPATSQARPPASMPSKRATPPRPSAPPLKNKPSLEPLPYESEPEEGVQEATIDFSDGDPDEPAPNPSRFERSISPSSGKIPPRDQMRGKELARDPRLDPNYRELESEEGYEGDEGADQDEYSGERREGDRSQGRDSGPEDAAGDAWEPEDEGGWESGTGDL